MTKEVKKNYLWVDLIKILAIYCVVFLHVSHPFSEMFETNITNWWISNIFNSFLRSAAPLFFMISGFLLLQKEEPLGGYFKKRFTKILTPFFFWSVFFILWKIEIDNKNLEFLTELKGILSNSTYYHLWFLYTIIGLYLVIPIMRVITINASTQILAYISIMWFITDVVFRILNDNTEFHQGFDVYFISDYAGYLVLGFWLGKIELKKSHFITSVIVYITAGIATAWATHNVVSTGILDPEYFYDNLTINIVLLSVAQFVMLRYIFERIDLSKYKSKIKALSGFSLGIYLIHPAIITVYEKGMLGFKLEVVHFHPSYGIFIAGSIIYMTTMLLVYLIQKTPVLKRICP